MKGQKKNKQSQTGKVGTLLHSPKQAQSRPSELNLAQARSLYRRWACFRPTCLN